MRSLPGSRSAGERLPLHDRGKVLVQIALMLAGGGESCADIEHLRLQADLFGSVPSDSTVFRTFHEIDAVDACGDRRGDGRGAGQGVAHGRRRRRGRLRWSSTSTPPWSRSTPRTRSRPRPPTRAGSASTRCSASPMPPARRSPGCCVRATPGPTRWPTTSACSTTPSPSCPPRSPSDTRSATTPALVDRTVVVRADSAGCTEGFLAACRARNVGFFVSARSNRPGHSRHLRRHRHRRGVGARRSRQDGEPRDGRCGVPSSPR